MSGQFTMVMDIVGFAQASAACTAVGKTLSNIDAIFSGPSDPQPLTYTYRVLGFGFFSFLDPKDLRGPPLYVLCRLLGSPRNKWAISRCGYRVHYIILYPKCEAHLFHGMCCH